MNLNLLNPTRAPLVDQQMESVRWITRRQDFEAKRNFLISPQNKMCKNSPSVSTYWCIHHQTEVSASHEAKKHRGKTCSSARTWQKQHEQQEMQIIFSHDFHQLSSEAVLLRDHNAMTWMLGKALNKITPLIGFPIPDSAPRRTKCCCSLQTEKCTETQVRKKGNLWEEDARRQEEHPFKVRRLNVTPPARLNVGLGNQVLIFPTKL